MTFLKLFLISLPIFFAIDMVWLGLVAKDFYKNQIGFLMKDQISWIPAIIFYLLFLLVLTIFVTEPAVTKSSWQHAAIYGALFGFITYATYDLTNLATLKDWPLTVVIVDIVWGTLLTAAVSLLTYAVYVWGVR